MAKIAVYHPEIRYKAGGEKVLADFLENTSHEVDVYTHYYDSDLTFETFEEYGVVELWPKMPQEGLFQTAIVYFSRFVSQLDLSGYDIFLTTVGDTGEFTLFRNNSVKTMGYCHNLRKSSKEGIVGTAFMRAYESVRNRFWSRFDTILSNSDYNRDRICDSGTEGTRVKTLRPGVPKGDRGVKGDYILYLSRFDPDKRQKKAVEIVKEVREQGNDLDLVLAGSVSDKKYLKELKQLTDSMGGVTIETNISETRKNALYRGCFCTVFLGKNEDFGLVPLESMSFGKPVVSVDEGGPKETILDGETGYLAGLAEIASAICRLHESPEIYEELSRNAKKHAKEFGEKKFVERLDEEIRKLMNK